MKRNILIFVVNIICLSACFAQLNKFEGTWIRHFTATYIGEDFECPFEDALYFFRFDVIDKDIQIRHKVYTKRLYLSNEEHTTYCVVKNIKVNNDTIMCDIYSPPEGNTRIKNSIPYETCIEHHSYKFTIVGTTLVVEEGPVIREFYSQGELVNIYKGDKSYSYEFYNEKDNW